MSQFRKLLFGSTLLILGLSSMVQAQVEGSIGRPGEDRGRGHGRPGDNCPPDPTYNCTPGYVRPGEPSRPPVYPEPGRPHPGRPEPGRPLPPPPPPVRPGPGYPSYPPAPPTNPGYGQYREIYLNRYMQNERVRLNDVLFAGSVIESVQVVTNGYYASYGTINLLADRRIESSTATRSGSVMLYPRSFLKVDAYGPTVEVEFQGGVQVERIIITYRADDYRNGPGYESELSQTVNQEFQGDRILDLNSLVGLTRYQGYRVTSVTVVGTSRRGFGEVELLADGQFQDRATLPSYQTSTNLTVRSDEFVGRNLFNLGLHLRGNIYIERIIVRVAR